MPIRSELRHLYPKHWPELSQKVRFERAGGRCQACCRPHGATLRCLPDGRWFDPMPGIWRNGRGRPAAWPDLLEAALLRNTRVVLAAAHIDHDPANNRLRNLKSLCQRCHMLHDRPYHLAQRWLTYRRRYAMGDLFFGAYRSYRASWYNQDAAIADSLEYAGKVGRRQLHVRPQAQPSRRKVGSPAATLWTYLPPDNQTHV